MRLRGLATEEKIFGDRVDPALFHARNTGMLDAADAVVAVWDATHRYGGTWSALNIAEARGMPGIWLDPRTRKVEFRLPTAAELSRRY